LHRTDIEYALTVAVLEERRGLSACTLMVFAGRYADIFHSPF